MTDKEILKNSLQNLSEEMIGRLYGLFFTGNGSSINDMTETLLVFLLDNNFYGGNKRILDKIHKSSNSLKNILIKNNFSVNKYKSADKARKRFENKISKFIIKAEKKLK